MILAEHAPVDGVDDVGVGVTVGTWASVVGVLVDVGVGVGFGVAVGVGSVVDPPKVIFSVPSE